MQEDLENSLELRYHQSLSWLFTQFPAYQKIGSAAYKPDLGNIRELIQQLNIDYSSLKFIHVAGTNGKGTVVNYVGSILKEAGYPTGIFTSPHLIDFRERIIVNGEQISQEFVVDFCEKAKNIQVDASFFEITFAMALAYFIEQKCEMVALETGLGGRLDATNIVTPILSVITNIGKDHTNLLGNTYAKIAAEKAGIIKPNVPVLIGEYSWRTIRVFKKKAKAMNAPLSIVNQKKPLSSSFFQYDSYKRKNEHVILEVVKTLQQQNYPISEEAIRLGFENIYKNTSYQGRFQVMSEDPFEIIDVAHNEAGMKVLMQSVKKLKYNNLHILYGSSSDKDFLSCVLQFPKDAHVYFTEFSNERSLKVKEAEKNLKGIVRQISFHDNAFKAYKEMNKFRKKGDLTIVTGSFFLLSDYFAFKDFSSLDNDPH